jgi:uncharacterized protein involved in response to NO
MRALGGGFGHALWQAPHRPLFFLAGLWALTAPLAWLLPAGFGPEPVSFHRHELLFGMGGAAVGGYLLTALPAWANRAWTGRVRVGAHITGLLCLFWLLARLTFALSGHLPFVVQLIGGSAYFVLLASFLARSIFEAQLWSRLWTVIAVTGLGLAEAFWAWSGDSGGTTNGPVLVTLLFALTIGLVGGRAVPAFTRHWLARTNSGARLADTPLLRAAALVLHLAALIALLCGWEREAGFCLILSALLQLVRLARWHSWHALRYPALFILHLAWLWLPLGLALTGLALSAPDIIDRATALHGLTMGAMGSMVLAIMARAAMVREDGKLRLGLRLALAFALVFLSAALRVLAPMSTLGWLDPTTAPAAAWMLGWLFFLSAYPRALTGPLEGPVLSAAHLRDQALEQPRKCAVKQRWKTRDCRCHR